MQLNVDWKRKTNASSILLLFWVIKNRFLVEMWEHFMCAFLRLWFIVRYIKFYLCLFIWMAFQRMISGAVAVVVFMLNEQHSIAWVVYLFTTVVYANKKPRIQIDRVHTYYTHSHICTWISYCYITVDRAKRDAKFSILYYSGDKCKNTHTYDPMPCQHLKRVHFLSPTGSLNHTINFMNVCKRAPICAHTRCVVNS